MRSLRGWKVSQSWFTLTIDTCQEGNSCIEDMDCGEGQCDEVGGFCECSKSKMSTDDIDFQFRVQV